MMETILLFAHDITTSSCKSVVIEVDNNDEQKVLGVCGSVMKKDIRTISDECSFLWPL